MDSKKMTNHDNVDVVAGEAVREVGADEELLFQRAPMPFAVPIEMVRAQKDSGAAFSLACNASGLADKEIYSELEIDAGYFSKIKSGDATLQANKIAAFCDRVGNIVYLEWLSYQCGYTNVMVKTEVERRLDAAERALQEERLKYRVLLEAMHGKVSA